MLQRYLLIWLTLLSLIAYAWPTWISPTQSGNVDAVAPFDPFAITQPALKYLFAATMFAIGCLLPRDEIREVVRRWPTVLGGTAIQYTTMPALAYFVGRLANLPEDLMLGVILVGCVPGAMASNVLTMTARGNISYSVSLTTSATLLSPLIVPVALYVTLKQTNVDAADLAFRAFILLILQVVGPVLLGHFLSRQSPPLERFMQRWGPVIANLTILWIIAVVVNGNHKNLRTAGFTLIAVLLVVNLLGYTAGFVGGRVLRLPDTMRRALTLEVGMQNAGLGTILAGQLFNGQKIVELPPALYTFGCMLTGTILAQLWAVRGKREIHVQTESEENRPTANGD